MYYAFSLNTTKLLLVPALGSWSDSFITTYFMGANKQTLIFCQAFYWAPVRSPGPDPYAYCQHSVTIFPSVLSFLDNKDFQFSSSTIESTILIIK